MAILLNLLVKSSQSNQNLQVTSDILMYLRTVRTYKSVVMYSCISEQSELTSQWLCTHASHSNQNDRTHQ